ncbi:TonB-dependent receptor [Algoriphagus antarcticus]|uniref:Fe(3+) dicitrate transport protein n=1 Tax=Algoriphagus antarcticus TaxID=238540 RepID=A0A3E0DJT1_9BACT|nr:TonB-dependent receptor [Algoriphagus antarcticus]REG82045.1 Fe(3+) dicitrate transport protein [Algoriphagus antarcticus]
MRLFYSSIFFYLLSISFVFAQRNAVQGKILDQEQKPIPGVSVIVEGTVRGVQSDQNGAFVIKDLPVGSYALKTSMIGFKTQSLSFSIGKDAVKNLDFVLVEDDIWLESFELMASRGMNGQGRLPEVEDFRINAGRKNEVIHLGEIDANLAMNNSRQIFGRTPGITIWENDGSGIQLGVASRGLSPNRSWEFNVRMNGYDITPDPMGYPEAYFTPPMEVVENIEIIRGASSLQYGPQFGGLLNFVLRKPDPSTRFTAETINTVGSNGLFSTFNYIGGTEGKWDYTAYYQKRRGNGWRDNGFFNTDHAHLEVNYAVSNRLKIGTEMTYMTTESQQPGGLTDAQFAADPSQSIRSRNWFSTPWFIPSLNADYIVSPKTKLNLKAFGSIAERNSVGFTSAITQEDDLGNRQVDRDLYHTFGTELRLSTAYSLFGKEHNLVAGYRFYKGNIDRNQKGVGNAGTDMNFDLVESSYPRDLDFDNVNHAAFVENMFNVTDKLLLTAGLRLENISSNMKGILNTVNGVPQLLTPEQRTRNFALLGFGGEYHLTKTTELYTNFSQAYRPVLISDLTPPATTDVIDANLKDARGYNFDLGYRGNIGDFLNFDASFFYLNYADRIGTITQTAADGTRFQFRTNLGTSVSQGVEAFVEFDPITAFVGNSSIGYIHLFSSLAFVNAEYQDFERTSITNGEIVVSNLAGNRVENAPRKINRYGATYRFKDFSMTWQLSDIGEAFSDATNSVEPNAAATSGLVPAYSVQDLSAGYTLKKKYSLKTGVNNLTDEAYFTRRAGGYPGPGIMPADGRTFYLTFGVKF